MWLNIPGVEKYQASEEGVIRHKKFLRSPKCHLSGEGYLRVSVWLSGRSVPMPVHRMVALAFVDNPDDLPFVMHRDGNRTNNAVSNLQWCSRKPEKISTKKEATDNWWEQIDESRDTGGLQRSTDSQYDQDIQWP
jgi:hypothetical protein